MDLLAEPKQEVLTSMNISVAQSSGQNKSEIGEGMVGSRIDCPALIRSERFLFGKTRTFTQQYSHLYYQRLLKMRSCVEEHAKKLWGAQSKKRKRKEDFEEEEEEKETSLNVKSLIDVVQGKRCFIIGTVYKEMKLKPNVLDEYERERCMEGLPPPREKYTTEEDTCVIEDESGRATLQGINPANLVTGTVMAVLGKESSSGAFEVEDYCFSEPPPLAKPDVLRDSFSVPSVGKGQDKRPDRLVAIVSGLKIGAAGSDNLLLNLLGDFLTCGLGSAEDQKMEGKICRVILAGNSVSFEDNKKNVMSFDKRNDVAPSVEPVKLLDGAIANLCSSIPVDLMPGESDPSNYFVPQQPLHKSMFVQSRCFNSFSSVTNPYEVQIGDKIFLGTSGQMVNDIYKYVETNDKLEILSNTLKYRHLAPTAPDTLGCYPYYDEDPFILDHSPHVYFAGNQEKFETKLVKSVDGEDIRIVCVPSFSATGTFVIVNLSTLDCYPVDIGCAIGEESSV
eukprot:Nk52_evm34s255 gene=Nk52_evmTU34s255